MKGIRLAAVIAAQYVLLVANIRYVAQGRIGPTVATDALIAVAGWYLIQWVAAAKTWQERVGYVVGAMVGSAAGILWT